MSGFRYDPDFPDIRSGTDSWMDSQDRRIARDGLGVRPLVRVRADRTCPSCRGGRYIPCPSCQDHERRKSCKECARDGRIYCPECGGVGVIPPVDILG